METFNPSGFGFAYGTNSVGGPPTTTMLTSGSQTTPIFIGDPISISGGFARQGLAADTNQLIGIVVNYKTKKSFGNWFFEISAPNYIAPNTVAELEYIPLLGNKFYIQSDGVLDETCIGKVADFVVGAGSTLYGTSGVALDASTVGQVGANQLRILGKSDQPGNDWGGYMILLVEFVSSADLSSSNIS